MRPSVEQRIRAVFPAGNDWERDDKQLEANDYGERITYVVKKCCSTLPMSVKSERWPDHNYDQFAFTHRDSPDFDTWIWKMDNSEKIHWINEHGSPYVVLWLQVSRVADFYYAYFNHWKPRGDTGYLDADSKEEPNEKWRRYSEGVFNRLHEQGFLLATQDFLRERVPFVLTWGGDEVPDSDPRWDDENFEPDPVPATVYDCLFGD